MSSTEEIITVYNVGQGREKADPYLPSEMTVCANCVGGKEGVMAFYPHPKNRSLVCIAEGDDGNWWYISDIHKDWVEKIIFALADYKELTVDMW